MGPASVADQASPLRTHDEVEAQERRAQLYHMLGLVAGGVIGIGVIGFAGWAAWAVAGIIAVKLGLLGFGWHALSMLVVGIPFIFTPIVGVASTVTGFFKS